MIHTKIKIQENFKFIKMFRKIFNYPFSCSAFKLNHEREHILDLGVNVIYANMQRNIAMSILKLGLESDKFTTLKNFRSRYKIKKIK